MVNIKSFKTPILYTPFKRLNFIKQTLPAILRVKPERLYIFSDGPRYTEEAEEIDRAREYIINECKKAGVEFESLFMEKNIGATSANNQAFYNILNWVFNKEKYFIYMEDDILAGKSFFYFMEKLLNMYKDEERVNFICGRDLSYKYMKDNDEFYFSKIGSFYGLGIWENKWNQFLKINNNILAGDLCKTFIYEELGHVDYRYAKFLNAYFSLSKEEFADDFRLTVYNLLTKGFHIRPAKNLVKNLGLTEGANASIDNYINDVPNEDLKEVDVYAIKYKKPIHDLNRDRLNIRFFKSTSFFIGISDDKVALSLNKILSSNSKIAIYAAGAMGKVLYKVWDDVFDDNVCCFLDDNKYGFISNIPIIKPENLDKAPDAVIISVVSQKANDIIKDKVKRLFPSAKVYNIKDIVGGKI